MKNINVHQQSGRAAGLVKYEHERINMVRNLRLLLNTRVCVPVSTTQNANMLLLFVFRAHLMNTLFSASRDFSSD